MDPLRTPPVPPRPPRRAPRQRRSRELVDAILQAARELLERHGPEALTTNRIAERAGTSIGSLYRYFPDKAAVVAALVDVETTREAEALSESGWPRDDRPLEAWLIRIVDYQIERHRRLIARGGDLVRRLEEESSLTHRLGADRVEAGMRETLERHRDQIRASDLDECAYLLTRGISAIVRRTLRERPHKLDQPEFRRELIDLVVCYVVAPDARA